jgi:polysaccharide export outer membrane protein
MSIAICFPASAVKARADMGHFIPGLADVRRGLFLAVAAAFLLAQCTAGTSPANKTVASGQSTATDIEPAESASALASVQPGSADYRISSRDIIEVNVFQVADLNKTVQVSEDGNATLPLIGRVPLRGKTTYEAEELIGQRLAKNYLRSPQVTVSVKQYGQRLTVSGEVKSPRVLAVDGRVTLTQAIANAGGFTDLADPKRVHVARTINGRIHDEVYDFEAIQAGQTGDPTLQGGDLVVAEQSGVRVTLKNIKDLLPFAIFANLL